MTDSIRYDLAHATLARLYETDPILWHLMLSHRIWKRHAVWLFADADTRVN